MRNEELGMSNKQRKKSTAFLCYLLSIICYLMFAACDNVVDAPEIRVENGYGRISIIFAGEDAARTILPSTNFDKCVYTFKKVGEADGTEKTPDKDGFFTLETGNYTLEVKAYTGSADTYTLTASGVSSQFSVGSGSNDPVKVTLSGVSTSGEGKLKYTITYPADAVAEISLQKWPEMNNISLDPVNVTQGNGKTQTLELETGSYLLTVLVDKIGFYAGINEAIHIYPAVTTEFIKNFSDNTLLAAFPITGAEIVITAPVNGASPNTGASGGGNFTIGPVSWSPVHNPFLGNTVYTATVTLTADSRYTFTGLNTVTINGQNAVVSNNTGVSVTLSHTFPATDEKRVTHIAIKTPPTKLTYTHGDQLDLAGLVLTLTHDDTTTEDVSAANFTSKNITTNPSQGNHLTHITHNGHPVTIIYGNLTPLNIGTLTVNPKVITFTVDEIPEQAYMGSAIQPAVMVRDGAAILTAGDYTVAYSNNTNVGTATVTISGSGNYAGSTGSASFTINPRVITFTVDVIPAQTYTGSAIQPAVTVNDGTKSLTLGVDYTAAYANNTNVGTANVTITGAGNYAGSTGSATFTINPISVTFNGVTDNSSETQITTALTLTFSRVIAGLTADDISLSGVSGVTKGTLGGAGPSYTLPISGFTENGTLSVSVAKSGYAISGSPRTAAIYTSPSVGIVINLAGMNEWELTEQTAQATPNANKVFTVTGTYMTYKWYLDGVLEGTSSSYTFNKPDGVHQLVVVVTNSNGESRSGRCRITVGGQPLTANVWANGSITNANGEDWYSFPVTSGMTYRIWWNDSKQGNNNTKTGDIAVSARYENAADFIFGGTDTVVDSGWNTAQTFTANQTGTVYVRVIPYNHSSPYTGTYGIVYSTSSIRPEPPYGIEENPFPLTIDTWLDGNITSAANTVWYSFNVTSGTTYRVWLNKKTINVYVNAIYSNGTSISMNYSLSNYDTWSFTANQNGTVKINVFTYPSGYTGTFAVAYSSSNIIGPVTAAEANPFPLTLNTWLDGNITSTANTIWYSFNVTSGTTYHIWWNDSKNGDSTKTLDVYVYATYSNGTSIYSMGDSGWTTGVSFTDDQTGMVKIKVVPYSDGDTGTFAIAYSIGTTRPAVK